MSTTTKKVLLTIVLAIVGYYVLQLILGLAISLFWTILPFALVGGVVYGLYVAYQRKAIGPGRRKTLL